MNKNKIISCTLLLFLSLSTYAAQNSDGQRVWYDLNNYDAFWASGEPNNDGWGLYDANCAVLVVASKKFDDVTCSDLPVTGNGSPRHVACFNGVDWFVTPGTHRTGGSDPGEEIGDSDRACPAGYQFAVPRNQLEIDRVASLAQARGASDVWINLSDRISEGNFVTNGTIRVAGGNEFNNVETYSAWNSGEPNNSGDCVQLYSSNGRWDDTGCSQSKRVACTNGDDWVLSSGSVNFGSDNDRNSFASAVASCPSGYNFSAPNDFESSAQIRTLASNAGVASVWINVQDKQNENIWEYDYGQINSNRLLWVSGQPNNSGDQDCAVMRSDGGVNNSLHDYSCTNRYQVACKDSVSEEWYITSQAIENGSVSQLRTFCQRDFYENGSGAQYGANPSFEFFAPVTNSDRDKLTQLRLNTTKASGVSNAEPDTWVWINAEDRKYEGIWQVNSGTANWDSGQPQFDADKQCIEALKSNGKWRTANCDETKRLICFDGKTWGLSSATSHQYNNSAQYACARVPGLTAEHVLSAPDSEGSRERVRALLAAAGGVDASWVNGRVLTDIKGWTINSDGRRNSTGGDLGQPVWYDLFDNRNPKNPTSLVDYETGSNFSTNSEYPDNNALIEKISFLNSRSAVYWAPNQPDNSGRCTQLLVSSGVGEGMWDDYPCTNKLPVACYDGFEWRISDTTVEVNSSDGDSNENLSSANNVCAALEKNGVAGNFRFAAPMSYVENLRLHAIAKKNSHAAVWINVQSLKYENAWKFNKGVDVIGPFWNTGEPNNSGGSQDCAQLLSSGAWDDVSCSASNRRFACFNPYAGVSGKWELTSSANDSGIAGDQIEEANKACEKIGSQFKYYSPVSRSENDALRVKVSSAGISSVWINANDQVQEGAWVINSGLNNWNEGEPASDPADLCVKVAASSTFWSSQGCATSLPVACSTGGRWYFTQAPITLDDFGDGQRECDKLGDGYLFAAPKTRSQIDSLLFSAQQEGRGGDFWINGYRQSTTTNWLWNVRQLTVPAWSSGEPNGNGSETCATMSADNWADAACESGSFEYLCKNSSGQWQVTSGRASNLSDFATGVSACAALAPADTWKFAAPSNYNENLAARNVIALSGQSRVWLNATDVIKEGRWVLNAASIGQTSGNDEDYANWDSGQPSADNCAFQKADGTWASADCATTDTRSWACTDGRGWRVTALKGGTSQFSEGHKACFNEFGGNFIFAAPLSRNDAIQLDFARLLAQKESKQSISQVWLNLARVEYTDVKSAFRYNLPFVNWPGSTYAPGVEPVNDCILKGSTPVGTNNPWQVVSCVDSAAHYACFNGSSWSIATGKGVLQNGSLQLVPKLGEDFWSYERGTQLCKQQHGSEFYFSAPVTAAEELALDAAIRLAEVQSRNTWINYYYVRSVASKNNRWFANRLPLGNWQKTDFDNLSGSDCAAVLKTSDTKATWIDVRCSEENISYGCLNLTDASWSVISSPGEWKDGFEVCANNNSLFAAPRTPDELTALLDEQVDGSRIWVNASDTAVESQWIVNRLRSAWWGANEPSNIGNKDCAVILPNDEWQARKCSTEEHAYACRFVDRANSNNIEWHISTTKGVWSRGFAVCAKEFPGSEFMAPVGYGNTLAVSEQTLLANKSRGADPIWINYSDQEIENAWRTEISYSHWGVDSLLDEERDCGYYDRVVAGKGTWYADRCKYTSPAKSRGFSCTNGYEWKIASVAPTTNQRWSAGFEACQVEFGAEWSFAAPSNGVDDAKLKLALELAGLEQSWINTQDRTGEGDWQINGPQTNFPIEIKVVADRTVSELQSGIVLRAELTDDEEKLIEASKVGWELLVAESDFANKSAADFPLSAATLTGNVSAGEGVLEATYSTPRLFKQDATLVFRIFTTDTEPGDSAVAKSSEARVTVTVKAPLLASYDFNDQSQRNKDTSGNGYDAFNSQAYPLPPVENDALRLSANSAMRIAGKDTDGINGLDIPADEYTIAMRISVEEAHDADGNSAWRGIFQKGNAGNERQPGLFLLNNSELLHARNSTSVSLNSGSDSVSQIPLQQWINIVYMKRSNGFDVYLDDLTTPFVTYNYQTSQNETVVDNNGDFWVGKVPGAAESFVGFADDIQIYDRVLNASELSALLPAPPAGEVAFQSSGSVFDEFVGVPGNRHTITVERRRGYAGAFTADIQLSALSQTLVVGTADAGNVSISPQEADVALPNGSNGTVTLNWADKDKAAKTLEVIVDAADDNLSEGSEKVNVVISSATNSAIGSPSKHLLSLRDLTPNPNGNFSLTSLANPVVLENDQAVRNICIVRESGAVGEVTVSFSISGSATRGVNPSDDYGLSSGANLLNPPLGSVTGDVVFADGDQANKCFAITVNNHPDMIAEADRVIDIEITNVAPTNPSHSPLRTGDFASSLTIKDYSPGVFAFASESALCYEPNQAPSCAAPSAGLNCLPSSIFSDIGSLECRIKVIRTKTGNTAPEGQLLITGGGSDISNIAVPAFPAIDSSTPAPSPDEQLAIVTVVSDNVQEALNKVHELTLAGVGIERIDDSQFNPDDQSPTAQRKNKFNLTVRDLTTPAVVTIDSKNLITNKTYHIEEGSTLPITVSRLGNPKTEFKVDRSVSSTKENLSTCDINDFFDFGGAGSDFSGKETNYSFSMDGSSSITWNLKTKKVYDLSSTYDVKLEIAEPCSLTGSCPENESDSLSRIAGLGGILNANGPHTSNRTDRIFQVGGDDSAAVSGVNSPGFVQVQTGDEDISVSGAANTYYAISKKLAKRSELSFSLNLPAVADVNPDCAFGNIYFSWVFVNPNGYSDDGNPNNDSEIAANGYEGALLQANGGGAPVREGVFAMNTMTSAKSGSINMLLPFTRDSDKTTILRLKVYYGSTSSFTAATASRYFDTRIVTKPRWRWLISQGASQQWDCVQWQGNRYWSDTCSNVDGQKWTYDPINNLLINKADNACASGLGRVERTVFGSGDPEDACKDSDDKWTLETQGSDFRIEEIDKTGTPEFWCQINNLANWRIDVRTGPCNGSDRNFTWGND
ncbi:lectin-like protein [Bacterioplanoides sp.]|uniref:lectin-like protein n=1 Tax=Bacterioplanoides sp. TaxID=2066072 RepID=UPI003B58EE50